MAGKKRINLALQGGGAHGAFTWGVLEVLLKDPEIEIAGITGTSAGALNGAALKSGMIRKGSQGALENLDGLWRRMGAMSVTDIGNWFGGLGPDPGQVARAMEYSLPYTMGETMARMISPYSYGPLYSNPLKSIVEGFDFSEVCAADGPRLFVCATNVRTGKARVFTKDEITTDVILASACLPTMFQAVEIEDPETGLKDAYWDGGYTGNPALFPLFDNRLPDDVVIININPIERKEKPVTPQQIQSRINEISFNAALLGELRAISFVQRLIGQGAVAEGEMKSVKVHMIADDDLMNDLSVATKSVPTPYILARLKEAGQKAAEDFLKAHRGDIGKRGTVDLQEMFT
ncbi:NTE family protein [Shimia gijangensis]|uniref:NTE family protein n=1 Tax=Shimia gijangensis TaxID=1470563 RepID=A0A1M6RH62_9RHOB|nr:patatin-like phospholipase family protein [Shimia gijangensis]SHK31805.1 NTE family protein [Shimia gijangensis]